MHILTIEDPIEFVHRRNRCLITQREVEYDTHSFPNAIRGALRQDPDVILVGELREYEAIQCALTAASTGHLVFASLHTQSAAQTVEHIVDAFPEHQQVWVDVFSCKGFDETPAIDMIVDAFSLESTRVCKLERGLEYLLRTQRADGGWDDPYWNGTGFPRVFYLKYHLYAHYFPLWALGEWRRRRI